MDSIAQWSAKDRADLFGEAAARKGIPAVLIEKDFWVCWTLKHLFGLAALTDQIIFKGGTSLSKAYRVIERFSEDIDITINRWFLGFSGKKDPADTSLSGKVRDRLLKELAEEALRHCRDVLQPALETDFRTILGDKAKEGAAWGIDLTKEADGSPTLTFAYPAATSLLGVPVPEYVRASVRIELGARGELWPSKDLVITPFAAEGMPGIFATPSCEIKVLEIERTFWEKATLLHAEAHRPLGKEVPQRHSRHYCDLAALAASEYRAASLKRLDLLQAVAKHKALFFHSSWARYDLAKPGTLRLQPASHQLEALRLDFDRTKIMFFKEPPDFDRVLDQLRDLEIKINSGK